MPFSPAQDAYVAPARLRPQLWRLGLGLVVILLVYAGWMAAMGVAILGLLTAGVPGIAPGGGAPGSDPLSLVALLASFAGMGLGAFAAVRWIHHRSIASLFGPRDRLLRDFGVAFGLLMLVSAPGAAWLWAGGQLRAGVSLHTWALFLLPALLGLLVQTGAEELVFRGYMQQQLAARFAARWVSYVVPSAVFGLLHYAPGTMGQGAWLLVAVTGVFGLLMADLSARSGGLGLAWGLHFGNNLLAILVFTTGEALDGLALFRLPYSLSEASGMGVLVALDMAGLLLVWGLCRAWLRGR